MGNEGDITPISKEELMREIRHIDARDHDLFYGIELVLSREKDEFFGKMHSRASIFRQIRGFAFISGVTAFLFFGVFFAYKGFLAKDAGMQKSALAYESFRDAENALREMNFYGAKESFSAAYENLVSAEKSINEIGYLTVSIAKNIPFNSRTESSIYLLRGARHIAKAGEIISSAFALSPLNRAMSAKSFLGILSGKDDGQKYDEYDFSDFEKDLSMAASSLSAAEDAMKNVNPQDFPQDLQSNIEELGEKIPALLNVVSNAKEYSEVISYIFGADAPRRYLVVFQNSSELRPSGGFIGSYAIIEFERGELKEMFVDGIYNADGQLTVNVIPPEPLQHISESWSTHDANWFLDFPTSAQKIKWFYERTGGGEVDGVIALNVEVVEQLLALAGPIPIEEYDLVLDAQNFRDEIQYEVEVAYDKKLNRPKKVLADFAPLFADRLFEVSKIKNRELISALLGGLEEKYIMFYSKNDSVQRFFENQGWAGSVARKDGDYLSVVHSNIGGHKTDKFMRDKIIYNAEIQEDGSIVGHLKIEKRHIGGDTPYWWYNRNNKDYIKIYVPAGARILSYLGGERREVVNQADYESLGFTEDLDISAIEKSLEELGPIDIFRESGKTVFGTWLVTSPGKTSVLDISYELPYKIEFNNGVGKYNLYLQKQPGTEIPISIVIDVPYEWQAVWSSFENDLSEQEFVLDTDKVIGYIFKK